MTKREQEQRVYAYICQQIEATGRVPTRKEVMGATGLSIYRLGLVVMRLRGAGKLDDMSLTPTALKFMFPSLL